MKVLSLFDGISCGLVALKRAGIPVSRYVAYEIDKYAKIVSKFNHPEIEQRGNVEGADWREFIGFDMVIGGFPCTNTSIGGDRTGLKGKHSSLFWEQVTAIDIINPNYFLVENNYGMSDAVKNTISKVLGVEPILINSSLVSAQQRRRYYWTNIPNIKQPEDKRIFLKDILESGVTPREKGLALTANCFKKNVRDCLTKHRGTAMFEPFTGILQIPRGYNKGGVKIDKAPTLTSNSYQCNNLVIQDSLDPSVYQVLDGVLYFKQCTFKVKLPDGFYTIRKLTPVECERLQTLPDYYTELLSDTQRYRCLGNGWTVDVIAHIFRQILLNEIM